MNSSAALKKQEFEATVQTEGLAGEQIVANNDVHPMPMTDNQIENVRTRIKAARLEHLMARQLETDLAIELTVAPQLENEIMAAMSETNIQCETAIEAFEPFTKVVEEQEAFRKNREECKTLVTNFQDQTSALKNLLESSGGLLAFINRIETEFLNAERAQKELGDAQIEIGNLKITNLEQSSALEQQTRQLSVLEALQESLSHNFSDAKTKMRELQNENQRARQHLKEAQGEVAALLQENSILSKECRTAKSDLANANESMLAMRDQLVEKDRLLSEINDDAKRLSQETELERDAYSDLKSRYDRLNVKSLEYQGQHLSRINELEETTTTLSENLDSTRREKEDLGTELEAVNKLLMLHGEMLDALSSKAAERSKH